MASDAALRIYRACQNTHMPMPRFSDDDFVNFAVVEALMFRALKQDQKDAKEREKSDWKKRGFRDGRAG